MVADLQDSRFPVSHHHAAPAALAPPESNHRHADFQYGGDPGSARASGRPETYFRLADRTAPRDRAHAEPNALIVALTLLRSNAVNGLQASRPNSFRTARRTGPPRSQFVEDRAIAVADPQHVYSDEPVTAARSTAQIGRTSGQLRFDSIRIGSVGWPATAQAKRALSRLHRHRPGPTPALRSSRVRTETAARGAPIAVPWRPAGAPRGR
jgi:hypothetical protein